MIKKENLYIRDPYIYFEDGIYYLYSSYQKKEDLYPSFVVYKSKDLEEFSEPITIFKGNSHFWGNKDFWAPEMHKYKNKYYLFASCKSDYCCRGTQIFISDNPDGNFVCLSNHAITPQNWECLDGTLWIEDGIPYLIFCHEWLQIGNGTICLMQLSDDLTHSVSEPKVLFSAKDAKWPIAFQGKNNYVTDGPFIIKQKDCLEMIWSSYSKTGYAIGVCRSKSIKGPWIQEDQPIYSDDGGHAMVFEKDGQKIITFHAPNTFDGNERLVLYPYHSKIENRQN